MAKSSHCEPDGTTDFQELQNAFREGRADSLYYYVFDLLTWKATILPSATWRAKRILAELLTRQTRTFAFPNTSKVIGPIS